MRSLQKRNVKIGAIYGRVSMDDAALVEHGSLEQQEHIARDLVKSISEKTGQKMEVGFTLIEAKGISGASNKRPKYNELLQLVVTNRIDFIVAKEISRLNRSIKDFLHLMDLCRQHNVALYIKGLDVDPESPYGKMMFTFMGMLAELERDMVITRTRESLRSAAINNAKINGGRTPLGFDRKAGTKGYYEINKEEMTKVRYIMQTFIETGSLKQTLDEIKRTLIKNKTRTDFTYNSLGRLLKNERYIGILRVSMGAGKEQRIIPLPYGCPIPRDLFDEVQSKLKNIQDARIKNRVGTKMYLLSSVLKFEDGTSMSGSSGIGRGKIRYRYYRAKGQNISIDAELLEKAVVQKLRQTFEDDRQLESCVTQIENSKMNEMDIVDSQIKEAQTQVRDLQKQENDLAKVISDSTTVTTVGWIEKRIKELQTQQEDLSSRLARLQRDRESLVSTKVDRKKVRSILNRALMTFELTTPAKQRGFIRDIFKEIKVFKDNRVEVRWAVPAQISSNPVTETGGGYNGLSSMKNGGVDGTRSAQTLST